MIFAGIIITAIIAYLLGSINSSIIVVRIFEKKTSEIMEAEMQDLQTHSEYAVKNVRHLHL